MPIYGPDAAAIELFVFREGLLSAAGHDLHLRATRFELEVDPAAKRATADVDAASLRVVTAMRGGKAIPDALSPKDVKEIEATVAGEILRATEFPRIRFASESVAAKGDGYDVRGTLALAGATRPVAFHARELPDGRLVAELRLAQPEFGIQPYSAMLGALKVRPLVGVRLVLPAAAAR